MQLTACLLRVAWRQTAPIDSPHCAAGLGWLGTCAPRHCCKRSSAPPRGGLVSCWRGRFCWLLHDGGECSCTWRSLAAYAATPPAYLHTQAPLPCSWRPACRPLAGALGPLGEWQPRIISMSPQLAWLSLSAAPAAAPAAAELLGCPTLLCLSPVPSHAPPCRPCPASPGGAAGGGRRAEPAGQGGTRSQAGTGPARGSCKAQPVCTDAAHEGRAQPRSAARCRGGGQPSGSSALQRKPGQHHNPGAAAACAGEARRSGSLLESRAECVCLLAWAQGGWQPSSFAVPNNFSCTFAGPG